MKRIKLHSCTLERISEFFKLDGYLYVVILQRNSKYYVQIRKLKKLGNYKSILEESHYMDDNLLGSYMLFNRIINDLLRKEMELGNSDWWE